uniref:RP23-like protein n=1 Tax=Scytodes thoracica TaxID=1112478 RepID=A0A0A0V5U1_SCYTH|nr:RP23-like protein [Scytodes thoracica]
MKVLPIALLLIGFVAGSPSANRFVDSVLSTFFWRELKSQNLDPVSLPNLNTDFQDKIPIIGKVKVTANYTDGRLTGLESVFRRSECQGPYYSYGSPHINCTIGFNNLSLHYNAKMKYGKMPKVSVTANGNITGTLVFVDFMHKYQHPEVNNLQFSAMGEMKIEFSGLGPLNRFLHILEPGLKSHVSGNVANIINNPFRNALNRAAAHGEWPKY